MKGKHLCHNFKSKNSFPPWLVTKPKIRDTLCNLQKKLFRNPDFLKQYVLEHLQKHKSEFALYTDGSESELGLGFALIGKHVKMQSSFPPYTSVYSAELYALKKALNIVEARKLEDMICRDSLSAIESIKSYDPKNS